MKSTSAENYYLDYSLSRDPFPAVSGDKKIYLSKELTQKLNEIKSLIVETEKVLVVTVHAGGGRTALSQQIELLKNSDWKTCLVRGANSTSIDLLAYSIVKQSPQDKSPDPRPPVSQVHKYLEQCANSKTVPVVIIDDAHKLPDKTLEFVLQLAELHYGQAMFRIVLFADQSIKQRLSDPKLAELAQNILHYIDIPRFSKTDIRKYVDHNLARSGKISEYPFIDEDFDHIYKQSGGLPKAVNQIARQIMQERIKTDSPISSYRWHIIGAGLLVLIVISAYFLYGIPKHGAEEVMTEPPVAASSTEVSSDTEVSTTTEAVVAEDAAVEEVNATTPEDISQGKINIEEPPEAVNLPAAEVAESPSVPVEVVEETTPEADVVEAPVTVIMENVAAGETPVSIPESPVQEIKQEYDNTNIFKLDEIPDYLHGIRGQDWLRQQPAGAYVLQLISASDLVNIEKLLGGQSGFVDQLSGYVKYTPSGKPRYLLLYGNYPDKETAHLAIKGMPEKFQSVNPWPRSIGDVVQEIDRAGTRR